MSMNMKIEYEGQVVYVCAIHYPQVCREKEIGWFSYKRNDICVECLRNYLMNNK